MQHNWGTPQQQSCGCSTIAKSKLRFTERDVSRAIRAVSKAGLEVARVVVDTAGNIVVVAAGDVRHQEASAEAPSCHYGFEFLARTACKQRRQLIRNEWRAVVLEYEL